MLQRRVRFNKIKQRQQNTLPPTPSTFKEFAIAHDVVIPIAARQKGHLGRMQPPGPHFRQGRTNQVRYSPVRMVSHSQRAKPIRGESGHETMLVLRRHPPGPGRPQPPHRAPELPREYQARLLERVTALLDGTAVSPDPASLAREVALFADRADITEELDRLGAHLEQVGEKLEQGREIGRSLDFLAQELLRETNTIGSKSSDVAVTQGVLALKGEVERFKEQVANIE